MTNYILLYFNYFSEYWHKKMSSQININDQLVINCNDYNRPPCIVLVAI